MWVRGPVLLAAAALLQSGRAAVVNPRWRDTSATKLLTRREDIGGILGGLGEGHTQEPHQPEQASTVSIHTDTVQAQTQSTATTEASRLPTSKPAESSSKTEEHVHAEEKTTSSNLIIGTPPPTLAPPTPATGTSGMFTSSSILPYPTGAAIIGVPKNVDPGSGPDWKVIGVAVIAISVIGTAILGVVFFDQWSRFLKDVLTGRRGRRRHGAEELVPDWQRGSWGYRAGPGEGGGAGELFGSPDKDDRQGLQRTGTLQQGEKRPVDVYGAREALEIPPRPFFRPLSNPFEAKEAVGHLSPESQIHQMYSPSPRFDGYAGPGDVGVHAAGLHRSNSTKTTITEDAYGGMAVDP